MQRLRTWGFQTLEAARPVEGETIFVKTTISPFASTSLQETLRQWGVDTLVLAGLVTHFVIQATAFDAADRGYALIVLSDVCSSGELLRHETTLKTLKMLGALQTSGAFAEALRAQLRS